MMTVDEYKQATTEVLNQYFEPLFTLIGAAIAVILIAFVVVLIISPFIKRV